MGTSIMDRNLLPQFLVVGAAKCGTTTIYHHLKAHPLVSLPQSQQEGRFFSRIQCDFAGPGDYELRGSIPKDLKTYLSLYPRNSFLRGDVSPDYLFHHENTIKTIKALQLCDIKALIVLRNPVERAYSQYMHFRRENREYLPFETALDAEEDRARQGWEWAWQYKRTGLYADQVENFIREVPNTRVFWFEDLVHDAQKFMDAVFDFLGLPSVKLKGSRIYNKSGLLRDNMRGHLYLKLRGEFAPFKRLAKTMLPRRVRRVLRRNLTLSLHDSNLTKPPMDERARNALIDYYRGDILTLEKLLGKDLSHCLR